jgi:hypothetical protein
MDTRLEKIKKINQSFFITKRNYLFHKNTFQYVQYRIFRPLLKFKYGIFRFFHKPSPWLSPASILFFENDLTKEHKGCEFGSGFSSLFFSKRIEKLVSIEHDAVWYQMIQNKLKEMGISNVEYILKPANDPLDFENEKFECETESFKVRKDFTNYFKAIEHIENEYFDFILVDGRARCECVYYSLPKLKKGGLLILDNSERNRYKYVFELLKNWEMINTTNGLTDTTFWVKP